MLPRVLFRLLASAPPGDHVPDAELLRRFAASNDAAALELVVRRHANAVWATCRGLLRSEADAEDAFQATFLALVRKVKAVRTPCAGGWLHRVAVNASLKLRQRTARTSLLEPGQLDAVPARTEPQHDDELAVEVHRELARLPERERLAVVLCDLEGLTHAEAAKVLGCPVGTLSSRLSRVHAKLRERLARRGITAPAVLFAVAVAPTSATLAALAAASGTASVPAVVSSLTEGVLSAMRLTQLKLTAVVVAVVGAAALAGVGISLSLGGTAPPVAAATEAALPRTVAAGAEPPKEDAKTQNLSLTAFPELKDPAPNDKNREETLKKACPLIFGKDPPRLIAGDDTYRRLLKAKLQEGRDFLSKTLEIIPIGGWDRASFGTLFSTLDDMRATALELWGNDLKVLLPWLEQFVLVAKYVEQFIHVRVNTGFDPPQNLNAACQHRLAAEAALWKAKKRG